MGGDPGLTSVPLGFADQVFFGDGRGNCGGRPGRAAASTIPIQNPNNAETSTTSRKQWFNCSDPGAAGDSSRSWITLGKLPFNGPDEVRSGSLLQTR